VKTQSRVVTTDAEIDAAIAQAKVYDKIRPRAVAAAYSPRADTITIGLATGVEIVIPRKLMQGLENASVSEISQVEVVDLGSSLHWESLDLDHYVPALIEGVFGNRRWMSEIGKQGGSKRSAAKTNAARTNGRKGGRPKRDHVLTKS
jgi:hypothetical protein